MLNTFTLDLTPTANYKGCQCEDKESSIVERVLAFNALAWNDGCSWNC